MCDDSEMDLASSQDQGGYHVEASFGVTVLRGHDNALDGGVCNHRAQAHRCHRTCDLLTCPAAHTNVHGCASSADAIKCYDTSARNRAQDPTIFFPRLTFGLRILYWIGPRRT